MGKVKRAGGGAVATIEKVVMGDGSKGRSGHVLEKGRFYASASASGGHESYFAIDMSTAKLSTRGGKSVSFGFRAASDQAKALPPASGPKTRPMRKTLSHTQKQKIVGEAVTSFCTKHPGWAAWVSGPGDRDKNPALKEHLVKTGDKILVKGKDGQCVAAAIANALYVLFGEDCAREAWRKLDEEDPHFSSLGRTWDTIHKLGVRCDLRKVPKDEMSAFLVDKFEWLASLDDGVWMVRLEQHAIVDHCIVVDAKNKLILDSAEDYPVRLSAATIRMCGGSEATALRVAEVRELREVEGRSTK